MVRPKIKEYFDIFRVGEDRYQIRNPEYVSVLKGKTVRNVLQHLMPLLDGERTIDEIVEKLDGVAAPGIIMALINKFDKMGIIEDREVTNRELTAEQAQSYKAQMMFFGIASRDSLVANEAAYQKSLIESRLSIIGDDELALRVATDCQQAGIRNIVTLEGGSEDLDSMIRLTKEWPPSLVTLLLSRPEPVFLDQVNEICLKHNLPLLHARINGIEGIVGPMVIPRKTACLKCHHLRMIRNYDYYDEYMEWERWIEEGEGRQKRAGAASLGAFTSIIAGLTSLEIVKRLSGVYETELYGKFLTVNALTLEVISHRVLRFPRCPSCGKSCDRPPLTPWIKDERAGSQGRLTYRSPTHAGKNGNDR